MKTNPSTQTACVFALVESQIREKMPRAIRLQRLWKVRKESLEEFLVKFFDIWNNDRYTIYADDESIQTLSGKRRSLGDIFLICKYYYPNCTLKEVLNMLYNTLPARMNEGFRSSYCHQIKKRVWYYDTRKGPLFWDRERADEFGHTADFYKKNLTQ